MSENYTVQKKPTQIPTQDNKTILEHFGRVSTSSKDVSIAHMIALPRWIEPPQTPGFDEYTSVIEGKRIFQIKDEPIIISARESIKINKHSKVQYSYPFEEPCEYLFIWLPVFSMDRVHPKKEI